MSRRKAPYTCPHCSDESYKSLRSGGITRCCGKPVVRVNGNIYVTRDDAPEWRVIQAFVVEKQKRLPHYDIPFGSTSYQQVLGGAKTLLSKCGGDVDLALEVIDISFNHEQHRWRDHLSFFSIVSARFLPEVLAIAKGQRQRQDHHAQHQQQIAEQQYNPAWRAAYAEATR